MGLKIGNNIQKVKINNSIISLIKFNGEKLYELLKESIINLTPKTDSSVYRNSNETISNFVYNETTGKCDFDVTINTIGSWVGLNLTNAIFSEHEGDYVRISVDSITSTSSLSNCYLTHYINYNITDDIDNTAAWYNLNDFISYDDKVVIANEFKNLYFCVYSDVTVPITLHISGLKAEIITRPKITIINDIYGSGYNKNYNYKTIARKKEKIDNLLKDENTICFTQLSDIHFSTDNLNTQNGYSQVEGAILSSKIFNKCNAIVVCGDYWNGNATENQISTLGANLEAIYEDAGCSLFNVKGNHDTNMHSSSMEYLIGDKLFNNHFTQKNKYVNCSASFDSGDYSHQNYYYVDDPNIKHRYIILNAFETDVYFDKFTELVGTSSNPIDFYPIWESLNDNNEKYYCILEGATLDGTGTYWFSRQLGYFQKNDNILYFYSYTDQNYNNYAVNTSAKTCSWNSYSNVSLKYPYSEGVQSSNQLNWLINSAMNMSSKTDWTVSIHTHDCMINDDWTTYFANDKPYMRKLFKAFKNGHNFTYNNNGINISKDFTSQGCIELIGVFAGHIHIDCYATVEGVDYYVNNGSVCQSELYSNVKIITPQRSWIGESSMSQNFYIYNRNTKKMDVVVLGVGEDKEFYLSPYEEEETPVNNYTIAENWVDYNNGGSDGTLTRDNLDVWISAANNGEFKGISLDFAIEGTHNLKATFEYTGYEGCPKYQTIYIYKDGEVVHEYTQYFDDLGSSFTRTINQVLEAGSYQLVLGSWNAMDFGVKCSEVTLTAEIPTNLFDLSSYSFPTTKYGLTFNYDDVKKSLKINGESNDDFGLYIPLSIPPGNYTFSYTPTQTDLGFYFSIDEIGSSMLTGWAQNNKTFDVTSTTSQIILWFDAWYVYKNLELSFNLVKNY